VKKILFLSVIALMIIGCKKTEKNGNADSGSKSDSTALNASDTASVKIDSTAPIKGIVPIEGVPEGQKIVFVNIDTLQTKYQYFVDENKAVKARLKQLEIELATKERAIVSYQSSMERRFQELNEKAQTMSPNEMKTAELELQGKEKELRAMQENYQKYKDKKQEEMVKQQDALNKKIKKRIDAYLEKLAESQKWDYILTYSDLTNPILYGGKKLDITKQIIKGLNEDYKSIKK
jgi:outer membrane protein